VNLPLCPYNREESFYLGKNSFAILSDDDDETMNSIGDTLLAEFSQADHWCVFNQCLCPNYE